MGGSCPGDETGARTPSRGHCVSEEPELQGKNRLDVSTNEWQMGQGCSEDGDPWERGLELEAGARLGRPLKVKVRKVDRVVMKLGSHLL